MKIISQCPLCGHTKSIPYYDLGANVTSPGYIPVRNVICQNCSLVYQTPRYSSEELSDYYSKYIAKTASKANIISIQLEDLVLAIARQRLDFLRQYLRDGMRVLDIGCSFGAMLKVLRDESKYDIQVEGINPESEAAEFGRKQYNIQIQSLMLEDFNKENTYDLIIVDNVLEHFDDIIKSLKKMWMLLNNDGLLFISTNNLDKPHGFLWQNFFLEHTVTFFPQTLRMALESTGFSIQSLTGDGHITYEGYHYPYILCIAKKVPQPHTYDFHMHAENAHHKIRQSKEYQRNFLKNGRMEKDFFLLRLKPYPDLSFWEKMRFFLYIHLEKKGYIHPYAIKNHTLPSKEYARIRLCFFVCTDSNDCELATKMIMKSEIGGVFYIFKKEQEQIRFICGSHCIGSTFDSIRAAYIAIENFVCHIDDVAFCRLDNANAADNLLLIHYSNFNKSEKQTERMTFDSSHIIFDFFDTQYQRELNKNGQNIFDIIKARDNKDNY